MYILQVNNRNTRTRRKICSKLAINTPELRQNFRETDISYPLRPTSTCAYQGVRNGSFSEILASFWCRFPLRTSLVNVTKSAWYCGFGHIYWTKSLIKSFFFIFCAVHQAFFRGFNQIWTWNYVEGWVLTL